MAPGAAVPMSPSSRTPAGAVTYSHSFTAVKRSRRTVSWHSVDMQSLSTGSLNQRDSGPYRYTYVSERRTRDAGHS